MIVSTHNAQLYVFIRNFKYKITHRLQMNEEKYNVVTLIKRKQECLH